MGLEAVEIVLEWEDVFGIAIPDAAAAVMVTPRHAIDWIAGRLDARPSSTCRTRRAFHRIRAALRDELGIPRGAIRPAARMDDLLPEGVAAERWAAVRERIGRGWRPSRVGWAGDVVSALAGSPRSPRYRGARREQTVADEARNVAAYDPTLFPAPGERWTREAVALTVRRIILEETGIGGFRDGDRFVEDMGID
jgi:hypothetical protein